MNNPVPVSLVILTFNEEQNIKACLLTATPLDDVHVLDSGSSDGTVKTAWEMGAHVHFNAFRGFGQQRNWAIDNIATRYDWQLHLDADERLTSDLIAEISHAVMTDVTAAGPVHGGYFVPSKLMFGKRWLRYAGQYPAYQVRLFHRGRLRFVDHGHGQREQTTFPLGKLKSPLLHYAFSKGLDHWFAKHAAYARREAEQALCIGFGTNQGSDRNASLFSADPLARRRALKRFSSRLPFRSFLRLCYMLFIQRAILDGAAGVAYAQMLAAYEAMVAVHLRLLRNDLHPECHN